MRRSSVLVQITPVTRTERASVWDHISTTIKQEAEQISHYRNTADKPMSDVDDNDDHGEDDDQEDDGYVESDEGEDGSHRDEYNHMDINDDLLVVNSSRTRV